MEKKHNISEHLFRSLLASEKLSREELQANSEKQLLNTLRHAATTTKYYSKTLQPFAHLPSSIDPDAWNKIPILTRAEIKDHLDDIASNAIPAGHGNHTWGGTSGTSGLPILTKSTMLAGLMQAALQFRFYARLGLDGSKKLISIKGDQIGEYPDGETSSTPWIPQFVSGNGSAPSVQLKQPLALEKQLEFLNRQGPCYLNTQPSNLTGLAQTYQSDPDRYAQIDLAGIICLGEMVQPYHHELARVNFNCGIMDIYSAAEVGDVAHQCKAGHLHINSEILHLETLREDGSPCAEHETGRIVITPTINWAMPLIRYDIGDQGALSHGCECGISLPVLKLTVGRERNLFKFSDGTSVLGLISLTKYHEFFPVRQWQIVQDAPEALTVHFVSHSPDSELNFDKLTKTLQDYFNRPLRISYCRQEQMSLTASGKLQEAFRNY
ncbi:MAG: hypothetical protein AAGA53_05275 [Pseudomonadota bacterium]